MNGAVVGTNTSGMYPIWSKTAREFITKLEPLKSGRAIFLTRRMMQFADEFDSWDKSGPPSSTEKAKRAKIIGDYMTCYRDALDILTKQPY